MQALRHWPRRSRRTEISPPGVRPGGQAMERAGVRGHPLFPFDPVHICRGEWVLRVVLQGLRRGPRLGARTA